MYLIPVDTGEYPYLANRESVVLQITASYHQLELQEASVIDYRALEGAYRGQKLPIDRLQAGLRSYIDLDPRLATYVQQLFTRLWCDHQSLIQKSDNLQAEKNARTKMARSRGCRPLFSS